MQKNKKKDDDTSDIPLTKVSYFAHFLDTFWTHLKKMYIFAPE